MAGLPEISAARTEPFQLERLAQAFGPEQVAIVYEQDRISPRLLSQLTGTGYTLVSLDAATGIGMRANGRQAAITSAHDLIRLIRQ